MVEYSARAELDVRSYVGPSLSAVASQGSSEVAMDQHDPTSEHHPVGDGASASVKSTSRGAWSIALGVGGAVSFSSSPAPSSEGTPQKKRISSI